VCLVSYAGNVDHLESCPHARVLIAAEPDNWVPEEWTDAQINEFIRQADIRRDDEAPNNP
jgi:hypothetical protein